MSLPADDFRIADWPVAILAGGLATRLRPITEKIPKGLVAVAGQPFLAHQLRLLQRSGIRKVVLCVSYRGEMIEQEFGNGSDAGMELSYSYDGPALLGTGGALKNALPLLGRPISGPVRRLVFADRLLRSGAGFCRERKTGVDDGIQKRKPLGAKQRLVRRG